MQMELDIAVVLIENAYNDPGKPKNKKLRIDVTVSDNFRKAMLLSLQKLAGFKVGFGTAPPASFEREIRDRNYKRRTKK